MTRYQGKMFTENIGECGADLPHKPMLELVAGIADPENTRQLI